MRVRKGDGSEARPFSKVEIQVEVIGLYGPSGTGKSYHAAAWVRQLAPALLIDDGLLIEDGLPLAGYSAKFEPTRMGAIKRAIFFDEAHAAQVRAALAAASAPRVVVLGTSRRMIERICARLELPDPRSWHAVTDLRANAEIDRALMRRREGLHAIPISSAKLDRSSFSAGMRSLLKRLASFAPTDETQRENLTIVHPSFARGAVFVHERAVADSLRQFVLSARGPFRVGKIRFDGHSSMRVVVSLHAEWIDHLHERAERLREDMAGHVRETLGFPYASLSVRIVSLNPPDR